MDIVWRVKKIYFNIPKIVRYLFLLSLFISLIYLSRGIYYRFFEAFLLLFLILENNSFISGLLTGYIFLSTIEIGKNFSYSIVSIPIDFLESSYIREYKAAVVLMDSDLILILILLFFLFYFIVKKNNKKNKSWSSFDLYYYLFWIITFISTIYSINFTNSFLGILQIIRGIFIYIIFRHLNVAKSKINFVLLMVIILLFQSSLGVLQHIKQSTLGYIFEMSQYLYTGGILQHEGAFKFYRSTGTLTEPNLYALILCMLLPFSVSAFLKFKEISKKLFSLTCFIFASLAIIFSFSRMGWFIYFAEILIFYKLYYKNINIYFKNIQDYINYHFRLKIYFAFFSTISLIYLILRISPRLLNINYSISDKWGSISARVFLIQESIKVITQYPFWGVGLFNFVPEMVRNTTIAQREIYISSVHNIYILLTSELGLFAVIILLFFLRSLIKNYLSFRDKVSFNEKLELDAYTISIVSFYFGGMFLSYYYAGIQYVLLNILLGLYANKLAQNHDKIENIWAKKSSISPLFFHIRRIWAGR